jgi:ribosome biogenesis GTPase / thiamine phosphate phosphatase
MSWSGGRVDREFDGTILSKDERFSGDPLRAAVRSFDNPRAVSSTSPIDRTPEPLCVCAKKKVRVEFRKNLRKPPRARKLRGEELVRDAEAREELSEDASGERISGRGELARRRTIVVDTDSVGEDGTLARQIDEAGCLRGRVLRARGTVYHVAIETPSDEKARVYECSVRRVVKTLAIDDRSAVVAGDRVLIRPEADTGRDAESDIAPQGVIERVEPRRGVLSRKAKGRRHVLAANVDQVMIIGSAADPPLKPGLVDRYLASARLGGVEPIIVVNKCDLVDPIELQPLAGTYGQLGYEIVLTSARAGRGISRLRSLMRGRTTAFSGQSGVGKSSLINAIEPSLDLKTSHISDDTRKGRHTTTIASLFPLPGGGWVVDSPGIRSLELWDVVPSEVEAFFPEFHPFLRDCRFADCSHRHESACGVKRALALGYIRHERYESYVRMYEGDAS